MSGPINHEGIQTALLLALLMFHLAPLLKRILHVARARRVARARLHYETHQRCAEVRDQAEVIADAVSAETKRRLLLIRSDPNDVA